MARAIKLETETKKISWGDSYASLLLGMVVVVVVGFIIFSFAKNKINLQQTSSVKDNAATEKQTDSSKSSLPKTYTVVAGDHLWSISEKFYKSGYNWVDIAKANKLENPSIVHVGVKLTIPDVKPKIITIAKQEKVLEVPTINAIKGISYTIVSGDTLWDIAVRAYSDGFRFVEIAKANNLSNPDLIFSGNKLTIPR